MSISENIKKYRTEKEISQEKLASKLDMSSRTLQSYEAGRTAPTIDVIKKIAIELDVPFYKLIINEKVNGFKKLEEVCKPVVDYLKKNYDPHCTVVITDSQIRLVRDEIGIPVGTAQEVPVREQFIGKCNFCGKENIVILPSHLKPKFCMNCSKKIKYFKMVHQQNE